MESLKFIIDKENEKIAYDIIKKYLSEDPVEVELMNGKAQDFDLSMVVNISIKVIFEVVFVGSLIKIIPTIIKELKKNNVNIKIKTKKGTLEVENVDEATVQKAIEDFLR